MTGSLSAFFCASMKRSATTSLQQWKDSPRRKPLVIRGARQVGKSYLVEELGRACFDQLVTLNLERDPDLGELFSSRDPGRILQAIELQVGTRLVPGQTLLFLDEIQAAPEAFAALRYFYEERPDIHVIAAGSLLDFAFRQPGFSVPVGRIEYLHLGPMAFEEFLLALGKDQLVEYLADFRFGVQIPEAIHRLLMDHVRLFLVVGGMPAAVSAYAETATFESCEAEKQSILNTFVDDFGKYAGRVDPQRMRRVFTRLPLLVGGKLKYVSVDPDDQARSIARALSLLCEARVAYRVHHTSANGVPLGAEQKDSVFKVLFVDVGLMTSSCGLNLLDFQRADELALVNQGAVCEQFVGQHLLQQEQSFAPPELFYWVREKTRSSAEVDYVLSAGSTVLPVEVKAGKTGTLRSMQVFLQEKGLPLAVRVNSDLPSCYEAQYALPHATDRTFRLLSIPFYLIGQLRRLIGEELRRS